MAHIEGGLGKLIVDGKEVATVSAWSLTTPPKEPWLVPCKIEVDTGFDYEMDGYCNPDRTRFFFVPPLLPDKYFLIHLEDDATYMRLERVEYDLEEARRWVLYG